MRLTDVLRLRSKIGKYSIAYSNLPMNYIERVARQVYWKTPEAIEYTPATVERQEYKFGIDRPWTDGFYQLNRPGKNVREDLVEPILNWSFFRGDRVEILVGKDKGKQGIVNYIVQERNWVIVHGLNCEYKMFGGSGKYPGVCVKKELPLLVTTQVSLVDPSDNKATSIEWRFTEQGENVRVSTRTGRIIPVPLMAEETIDYKTKSTYIEQSKDTNAEALTKMTFEPKVKTFEMDIMDQMGIKEDCVPQPTFWY